MDKNCDYKSGSLPSCAPLAMAYVPMQDSVKPAYDAADALTRGTLFPGLDLPFMNMVNKDDLTGTPLGELMSLDFVAHELRLYLDTHCEDTEEFEMLQSMQKLANEAHTKYARLFGPLMPMDFEKAKSFTWLKSPWPWEYCGNKEG